MERKNDLSHAAKVHRKKLSELRFWYIGGIIVLICLGLLSRKISFIPAAVGDAIWAMMVYCCWRIIMVRRRLTVAAMAALITSFAVEFSQMLTMPWLVRIRSTFLGHMLLGQGFLWSDLLAYTFGIIVIYLITFAAERNKSLAEQHHQEEA